ncbi:hypothetical protein [Xanthovirga aplysinae]|uniref:hypothetical protein n=1 Tax=Xanthovirga aplysinae TaxID=2529853 RepID=UPI0012BC7DDE|nr:hypothetical protein [Xanthovirga aplysinae]MTI29650.1 hypothetical protein [Xanthovirga aplysinae]
MEDRIYISFNNPKKKTSTHPKPFQKIIENAVVKIISTIIPIANPDFDQILEKVDFWKIEFNKKKNATWREIGFDKKGNSIVAMPLGNNYGYWTDNQLALEDYKNFNPTTITSDEFEKDWKNFVRRIEKKRLQTRNKSH